LPEGIILKGVGGFYDVLSAKDYTSVYTCKVRGIFRKESCFSPLTGDRVSYEILDENKHVGHITRILERRNSFVRPPVANIDQLAIVIAVANPGPDLALVDKLIITCLDKKIEPLIILNKIDLDKNCFVEKLRKSYKKTGFPIVLLSKFQKDSYYALHQKLKGFTTAFAGQSGVGKSTILNIIMDNWLMETGSLSGKTRRGKHTTRHVQLFMLNEGGFILDTPGFSNFTVSEISHQNLDSYYPEFREALGLCRFTGCSHISEPDCKVRELVNNGEVDEGRYKRYTELYKELKTKYDNRYRR
jgi:ribosome biogenesis GTPase